MLNQTELVRSVRLALAAGLAVSFAAPVFAQSEEKEDTLEEVEVLGTRIKRTDSETASPVLVIDAATIERSGAATIGDVIQDLPAIAGAATNPSVNNGGGDGAATISLRGLGDQRTLLLVNGRRVNYNDVNSIPANLVKSISVLKDGASAIYGSDAIGGVVDFQLKNDFEGGQVSLDYGITDRDDGERQGGSAAFGVAGERGNFMVNLNYSDQRQVAAADRDFSRDALTLYSGAVTVGGSSRTTTGRYVVPQSVARAGGINCTTGPSNGTNAVLTRQDGKPGTQISDFRCFSNASDLFNYQAVGNLELTPQERAGLFFAGNFNVTDDITAFAEAWTQNTRSAFQIAPLPFDGRPGQDEVVLSANSIYNPFGVNITDSRLRLSRIGNRRTEFKTDSKQINAGLRGNFGETSWGWETAFTYGKLDQDANVGGYLLTSALVNGLGPSFRDAAGVARCGTPAAPIAGCVPVDFFGAPPDASTAAGQAQLAALNAIATKTTNNSASDLKVYSANFTGSLFETSAGEAGAAIGFERREESLTFQPDFLAVLNSSFTCLISSEACTTPTSGETTVNEVFGELLVPLLADVQFAERLNVNAGVRWSDYDSFGNTTNGKVGFEWKPFGDLLVRGTYAQVFRAPQISDLFGGQTASSDSFTDPCNGYGTTRNPRTANGNIACRNVPLPTAQTPGGFVASDTQLSAILGGNPNTGAEDGEVVTFGFVYSPEYLTGASATVDFWDVSLKNTIGSIGTQNILNSCFTSGVNCELFSRGTDGEILRLFNKTGNIGKTDTNGVDIGLRYNFETETFGKFRINVDSTYLDKYDTTVPGVTPAGVVIDNTRQNAGTFLGSNKGGDGNYSRWRSLGNLTWTYGDFDVSWTSRYVHRFVIGSDNRSTAGGRDPQPCADFAGASADGSYSCRISRGAQTYHNIAVGYRAEVINTQFRFGIDNAFDKQPPIIYQNNSLNGNTDERTYDTIGRAFWISATTKF
jgi:iron complex outermembrane recepter protein